MRVSKRAEEGSCVAMVWRRARHMEARAEVLEYNRGKQGNDVGKEEKLGRI